MASPTPLSDWLDFLWEFLPPTGHLVVGAGSGTSAAVRYLIRKQAGFAALVEADETALRHLQTLSSEMPAWQFVHQVVSRETEECCFFHASLPSESGIMDPHSLRGVWPNISLLQESRRDGVSLLDLAAGLTRPMNWLWVDCFPAVELLEGAGPLLEKVDVIIARCLFDDEQTDPSPAGTSAAEMGQSLEPLDFRLLRVFPGWHPRIGTAVYVRAKGARSLPCKSAGGFAMQAIHRPAQQIPGGNAAGTASRRTYYGLHGLDRKIEAYLNYQNGYFIELGANDGKTQSNTLFFEENRGWRGLLIEPVLHNFLKCRANRSPENHFACCACVSFTYPLPYVPLVYSNLMTTPVGVEGDIVDPKAHAESGSIYLSNKEVPVDILAPARTLSSLLDEAGAPAEIDFLSLDVEGAEIEVLKGIDHKRYRFRYILVESREVRPVSLYLGTQGYKQIDQLSHHDYLFATELRRASGVSGDMKGDPDGF